MRLSEIIDYLNKNYTENDELKFEVFSKVELENGHAEWSKEDWDEIDRNYNPLWEAACNVIHERNRIFGNQNTRNN